ncbi:DUF2254 domain-containing protein [Pluralibacter gergoviae]|uniref:DUF2254 domain-containing protein n=1 Tax=Pluralibacter gergoviae TaxID=61647 RepID=UPI002ED9D868
MASRWQWVLAQTCRKIWFRATLFAIAAAITALLSIVFKSAIPPAFSVRVGADAVDSILNILASSMLAVTTFSLNIMVAAYGSATTNVTPRATRLVVEDATTQNVLATFIGSFLFSLVGIIALSMGAYGDRGRVILFAVTLVVIALILITLLRWIQHLTSLGRVGETTARVEQAACEALTARAQAPCLGGYPWLESDKQPAGTVPLYLQSTGYVEHVDIDKLASLLKGTALHVYLVAQPGTFVHPTRPVMFVTDGEQRDLLSRLYDTLSIGEVRSFNQDPRFCLCVMAEIASRALSPAVNDPGTAIDVIGRGVRVLSTFAQLQPEKTAVQHPNIHIAPLAADALFDDFFSPIARDGAAVREVEIKVLKALAMLADGWPDRYGETARQHAAEALQYIERAGYVAADRRRILNLHHSLFPRAGD